VDPNTPVSLFAVRLSDSIANDPRRITQSFPTNGTITGYTPLGENPIMTVTLIIKITTSFLQ
jgi:hypothetical protein